jgi:hypothetical protein
MFVGESGREMLPKIQNWAGKVTVPQERSMLSRNGFHQQIELVEFYLGHMEPTLEHVSGRIRPEIMQNLPNLPGKVTISLRQIKLLRNGFQHRIELVEFYLEHIKLVLEQVPGRICPKKCGIVTQDILRKTQ